MTQEDNAIVNGNALRQTLTEMKGVMPVLASEEDIRKIVTEYNHAEGESE